MIKNIIFTVIITLTFFTGTQVNSKISEFSLSDASKECPKTMPSNDILTGSSYIVDLDQKNKLLTCIYDEDTLLLDHSVYISQENINEVDFIALMIGKKYNKDGNVFSKDYIYTSFPYTVFSYKIYDEHTLELISHREMYNNRLISDEFTIIDYEIDRSNDTENVFLRIIEILENESLD